ncbi:Protein MAK32 [Kluyveromyces marxianus]
MALLTTNGMLIIDEIETESSHYYDILGGGGMYAILGASICCSNIDLRRGLLWIVDRGSDFPDSLTEAISSWGTGCVFRDDKNRLTTRGYNLYGSNDFRQFEYLSPKKRIDVEDWCECFSENVVQEIRCYHLLCSADRVSVIINKLEKRYDLQDGTHSFVWEPIPDLCTPDQFPLMKKLLNGPNHFIFSPNAEEGARMLGESEPTTLEDCRSLLVRLAEEIKPGNVCVLRCGKEGSLAVTSGTNDAILHFPAYHYKTPELVIDPTGGGNTFLGGFAFAYAMCNDISIASICGDIAAGCAIEQYGVPVYQNVQWNKRSFADRLSYYLSTYDLKGDPVKILEALSGK